MRVRRKTAIIFLCALPAVFGSLILLSAGTVSRLAAAGNPPASDPRFDPALRYWLEEESRGPSSHPPRLLEARGAGGSTESPSGFSTGDRKAALLDFEGSRSALEGMGFTVLTRGTGVSAVVGPRDAFRKLAGAPGFLSARLSRPVKTSLDSSLAAIHAGELRSGQPPDFKGPTGKGVIVGIVDTGVDIYHRDFRKPDGSSRILAFWDQYSSGSSREVPIGRVYRRSEMSFFLSNDNYLPFDENGHGTHVAGIAAGNGSAGGRNRYYGVAPDADLVIVRTQLDEASVAAGVQFVFDEADRRGEPAVVNLSLGHQYGSHDGTDPFERVLSDMCRPGRLVCVAAGNEGNLRIHARLDAGAGSDSVTLFVPTYPVDASSSSGLQLDAWMPAGTDCEYTLVLPQGDRLGPVTPGTSRHFDGPGYTINLDEIRMPNGRELWLEAQLYGPRRISTLWTLVMTPRNGSLRPRADFWIPWYDLGEEKAVFVRGLDRSATLGSPANGRNVVAVSAFVTKTCWTPADSANLECYGSGTIGALAPFSSLGPTRDGRMKPEVSAPGMGIVSSLSRSLSPSTKAALNLPRYLDKDGVHWISAGTSMAAPHVTGAVALLLERAPDLAPEALQARLAHTGTPVESPEGTYAGRKLDLYELASRPVALGSFAADPLPGRRARVRWTAQAIEGSPVFHLSRAIEDFEEWDRLHNADRTGGGTQEFIDGPLEAGRTYAYALSVEDAFGVKQDLDTLEVAISGEPDLILRAPRGNPGPPPVRLSFYIPPAPDPVPWTLDLFDVSGRLVRRLGRGSMTGSERDVAVVWDGLSERGRPAAQGLYLLRLGTRLGVRTEKVMLTR